MLYNRSQLEIPREYVIMGRKRTGTVEQNGMDEEEKISLRAILTRLYAEEYGFGEMNKEQIDLEVQERNEGVKPKDRIPSLENYIDERSEWFKKFMDIIIEPGAANKLKDKNGHFRFVKDGQVQWMIEHIISSDDGGYGSTREAFQLGKRMADTGGDIYEMLHQKGEIRRIISQKNRYYKIGIDEVEALRDFVKTAYSEAGCREEDVNEMVEKFDSNFPMVYFEAEESIREIIMELVNCRERKNQIRLKALCEICEDACDKMRTLKY